MCVSDGKFFIFKITVHSSPELELGVKFFFKIAILQLKLRVIIEEGRDVIDFIGSKIIHRLLIYYIY